jgi:hypothetical protein
MSSALDHAAHHARAYLAILGTSAVAATASRRELLLRLDLPLTREGVAADVVIDERPQSTVASSAALEAGSSHG